MLNLFSIGVNHRTAPIEVRERLWFSKDEIRGALPLLKKEFLQECVLISTCNRTELYGLPHIETAEIEKLRRFLLAFKHMDSLAGPEHFYSFTGPEAVKQLFRVATGIDSMIPGDVQILGQVKEAYWLAQECNTLGLTTTKLFQTAFHAGKRARTETEISEGAISISFGAVELAGKIFEDLHKKTALLIGAGKTGELTAKHLRSKGIGAIYLTNRTRSRAEELASKFGGIVIEFDEFKGKLKDIDIVISAVASRDFILTADDLSRAMRERRNQPLLIVDIGVPRNIDPTANKIENVFLHDIDALQVIVQRNLQKRMQEIPKVEKIIDEELSRFFQWESSLEVNPTIEQLLSFAEDVRQKEVHKYRHRFQPEELETVHVLTKRIIKKILHRPLVSLKKGSSLSSDESLRMITSVRKLFGLGTPMEPPTEGLDREDLPGQGDGEDDKAT